MIPAVPDEILEGADLSQGVVQVVEGHAVDVGLLLPARAAFQIGEAGVIQVRQEFLFQLAVLAVALGGRSVRMQVDPLLEGVHRGAVGQKLDGGGHMAVVVFFRVRAEEAGDPGMGEELHGHGVDLRYLHGVFLEHAGRHIPLQIALQRVAGLVGQHVYVA